jgi:hypothetical protein
LGCPEVDVTILPEGTSRRLPGSRPMNYPHTGDFDTAISMPFEMDLKIFEFSND